VFKDEILRGLLLNAYAFGTVRVIAGIAAFIAAAVLLVLGSPGLMHARRTPLATDMLTGHPAPAAAPRMRPPRTATPHRPPSPRPPRSNAPVRAPIEPAARPPAGRGSMHCVSLSLV